MPTSAPRSATGYIYRVQYRIAGVSGIRNSYLQAASEEQATAKLAERFPDGVQDVHIIAISEEHGEFVIGSEDRIF